MTARLAKIPTSPSSGCEFVFQSFHLLPHRSTRENVQLALVHSGTARPERRRRAQDALEQVGLGHRLDALPTRLSGGVRQRAAIARARVSSVPCPASRVPPGPYSPAWARSWESAPSWRSSV
ncbi:ATP-binding cassette domain-containing protein [Streptomyces sp. cmx-18-6]|uniref:ATP-binding cassette domain-containing protein n=1 Tax=Streptomyces sp. cmx-18-6 TaxID=2790930 RepID=UPI00397F9994